MMKAVVIEKPFYATIVDCATPSIAPNQVLVRVGAVGICASDVEVYEGTRPADYVRYPCQPGHEWAGTVVAVGREVAHLKLGDRVAVEGHHFCGKCYFCQRGQTNLCQYYNEFGFTLPGAYADYVAVRADLAHPFTPDLPFEVAALTEPAACAGHGLLRAGVQSGDTVVVIGPGTIGLLGVAWAKALGAGRIIAVGVDRNNEGFARAGPMWCLNRRATRRRCYWHSIWCDVAAQSCKSVSWVVITIFAFRLIWPVSKICGCTVCLLIPQPCLLRLCAASKMAHSMCPH